MKLDLLPLDIYEIVFEYLDCFDVLQLRLVSHGLNNAVESSNRVNIMLEANQDPDESFWGTAFCVTLDLNARDLVSSIWPKEALEDLKNYKSNAFNFWLRHVKLLHLQEESIQGPDMYEFVDTVMSVFEQNEFVEPLNIWLTVFINGERSAKIIERVEKSHIAKTFDLTIIARRELGEFEDKELKLGERVRFMEVFHYPFKMLFPPIGLESCHRLEFLNVDCRSQYILVDFPRLLAALEGKDRLKSVHLTGAGLMSCDTIWKPFSVPQLVLWESNRVPDSAKVRLNFQGSGTLRHHANFIQPANRIKCNVKRLSMTDSTLEYFKWFDFSSLEELKINYNVQENIYQTSVPFGGFHNLDQLIVRMHDWDEFYAFTVEAFKDTPLRVLYVTLIRAHNDLMDFSPHFCQLYNLQVLVLTVWNYDRAPDEFFEAFEDFLQPLLLHCPNLKAVSVKTTCYPYSIRITNPVLTDYRKFMQHNNGILRGAISNETKALYNNLESWQCQIGLNTQDFDYDELWDLKKTPQDLIKGS